MKIYNVLVIAVLSAGQTSCCVLVAAYSEEDAKATAINKLKAKLRESNIQLAGVREFLTQSTEQSIEEIENMISLCKEPHHQ